MNRNPRSVTHERKRRQASEEAAALRDQIAALEAKVEKQHKEIVDGLNERNRLHAEIAKMRGCYDKPSNSQDNPRPEGASD